MPLNAPELYRLQFSNRLQYIVIFITYLAKLLHKNVKNIFCNRLHIQLFVFTFIQM
jgi:hypothetical protein